MPDQVGNRRADALYMSCLARNVAMQSLARKFSADLRFEYYDKDHLPTTSWVQVQRLVDPGFLVEIEVIAELP